MRNRRVHKFFCFVLVLVVCLACFCVPVMATDETEVSRFEPMLEEILDELSEDEMIPVSIWFEDIDKTTLAEETTKKLKNSVGNNELMVNCVGAVCSVVDAISVEVDASLSVVGYSAF